jgi:hypothetical protein
MRYSTEVGVAAAVVTELLADELSLLPMTLVA